MKPPESQADTRANTAKPHSGSRWFWLLVLVVVAAGAWYWWSKGGLTPAAAGSVAPKAKKGFGTVPVVAVKAHKGNIGVYINGLGNITPIYTDMVKSRVDGELMSIHFKEGDIVHKGDLLIEIDPRPYQVALEQAEGQKARDEAILANARVDLDRYANLLKQNAVNEQQWATQKALVEQTVGTVKTDQGIIDADKLNLVYCNITASISGRIGLRLVDPGNIVHATDTNPMLVITQVQPISAIFTVAEDDLGRILRKIAAGQHLQVDAYARDGFNTRIGTGTLETVDNQIDPTTGSLRLRAIFDNSDNQLFPNQFVNLRLLLEQKNGVVLVNNAAIQRYNNIFVWVVKDDHTVTARTITLGVAEGDYTEVTSGLDAGDVVVMTGVDKLSEGAPVTVAMADETPAGKSGGKKK
ncbi:MAG TPA: efflux RND transporter periplasmic adaptor subunit [Bryobacteraceae bacterium]|nr:efflux RND transporter periplasmic adaptor subunit [Bryobacteraceae bacterium]